MSDIDIHLVGQMVLGLGGICVRVVANQCFCPENIAAIDASVIEFLLEILGGN